MVLPDALKVLRLQHGHRFCKLGDLAFSVRGRFLGWGGGFERQPAGDGCTSGQQGGWGGEQGAAGWQAALERRRGHRIDQPRCSSSSCGESGSAPCAICSLQHAAAPLPSRTHAPHTAPPTPQVGWKHQGAVAELEAKRKTKATAFYEAKKKAAALRAKAVASL